MMLGVILIDSPFCGASTDFARDFVKMPAKRDAATVVLSAPVTLCPGNDICRDIGAAHI